MMNDKKTLYVGGFAFVDSGVSVGLIENIVTAAVAAHAQKSQILAEPAATQAAAEMILPLLQEYTRQQHKH